MTPDILPAESFVLAGGSSRRFGEDKVRYLVDEKPMARRIYDLLGGLFEKTTLITKKADIYLDLGISSIPDHYPQIAPIVGLMTALEKSGTDWSFVAACDLPNLTADLVRLLWNARAGLGIIPVTGERLHPLAAFYHSSSLPFFAAAYRERRYALRKIINAHGFITTEIPNPDVLKNINRPSDL